MNAQKWWAGLVVLICIVMLIRLVVGARRRAAMDRAAKAGWHAMRAWTAGLWHWRQRRQDAARMTEEAIQRARRQRVDKDGNVLRPQAFKEPRKPH